MASNVGVLGVAGTDWNDWKYDHYRDKEWEFKMRHHLMQQGAFHPMDIAKDNKRQLVIQGDKVLIDADKFVRNLMGNIPGKEVKVHVEKWGNGSTGIPTHEYVVVGIFTASSKEVINLRESVDEFPSTAFLAKLGLLK